MKHIKQIDGLRFVAVFLVLIEHFAAAIGGRMEAGFYGVDLFFAISGYLITSILLNTQEPFGIAYKKFLGRRTLRIFPLYYTAVLVLWLSGQPVVKQYIFNFLTYTYNYADIYYTIPASTASHFWSLSVEEQFYLFWPILILLIRKNSKTLLIVFISILAFCALQFLCNIVPNYEKYNAGGLYPRAYSLVIGALGAWLVKFNKLPPPQFIY